MNDVLIPSPIQVEDQMNLANKYLTDTAKNALSRKSKDLTIVLKDGTVYECIFLGAKINKANVEKGVEKICSLVNELASKDLIHSALAPMISLDFVKLPLEVFTCGVLSYILVPDSRREEVNQICKEFLMNGNSTSPKELEDLSMPLSDGEFGAEIRLSVATNLISNMKTEDRVQQEIDLYLKILPEGTQVRSVTPCGIMGLSIPYEVVFFNPKLKRVKSVDLDFVRSCEVIDEKVEQFNVFTGIKYFDKDKKELFK